MPPLRASVRTKLNWYSVLHIAGAQKMLVSFSLYLLLLWHSFLLLESLEKDLSLHF